MNLLICIDDTDNVDSRDLGELAELMARGLAKADRGRCSCVTRHQLLVHDDIPYTSHNSAMCFSVKTEDPSYRQQIIAYASDFLGRESAAGSDPGLAVANIDSLRDPEAIIRFGLQAKMEVLTKEAAYTTAQQHGIHLSEHGGTGQGIIGALAGIGLRLGGNDGRVKGRLSLGKPGHKVSVSDLLSSPEIDAVISLQHQSISADLMIELGDKVKTVWLNHQAVLLVEETDHGGWKTCGMRHLRTY